MNHRPFEDWLLNDMTITPEQKRELDAHLRDCGHCSALAKTGTILKSARKVSPPAGFTARFQARLAERQLIERRRRLWGAVLFTLGGLALLVWLTMPYLVVFFSAPAAWISVFVGWGIFLVSTLQALTQAGSVLLGVLPGVLPPFVWMVFLSAAAGIGLLWSVSIWRFSRVPQGV
jgi:hypothetical protein